MNENTQSSDEDDSDAERGVRFVPDSARSPVTVSYVSRNIDVYAVSESELASLASGYSSVNLALFGVAFGSAVAFALTLLTSSDSIGDRVFATFVALLAVALVLTFYFGWRALIDRAATNRRLKEIMSNRSRNL